MSRHKRTTLKKTKQCHVDCGPALEFISPPLPVCQGECADEFFLVTGGSAVPPICGVNNAQHVIYSVTPDSGPSQLSVILSVQSTQSSNARLWNMRVYQYECTSPVLAPVGCLQHFTGASGMVRTTPSSHTVPNFFNVL